jgi:hypothetical protein
LLGTGEVDNATIDGEIEPAEELEHIAGTRPLGALEGAF